MATWHAKSTGGYIRTSAEAIDNATLLATALYNIGWVKKSICALLGNGAGESGLNPWRWESDIVPTVAQFNAWTPAELDHHGYGIFQFTKPTKYINNTVAAQYAQYGYGPNFSDSPGLVSDGNAQTVFFSNNVAGDWSHGLYNYYYDDFINIGVDISPWYYTNYNNFILGVDNSNNSLSLNELVGVFELCYERPGDTYAASSYNARCNNAAYWMGVIPDGPTTQIPVWLLFKFNDWRRFH